MRVLEHVHGNVHLKSPLARSFNNKDAALQSGLLRQKMRSIVLCHIVNSCPFFCRYDGLHTGQRGWLLQAPVCPQGKGQIDTGFVLQKLFHGALDGA